ncbi:factor of DNA methylation 1-like [Gossypium australe]|uniref:Factor of DNA methylation 1-like n=1 Tax=Gossypium australe TaxID=47621 RepID=A0A5B6X6K3_9ROSI|nr:factor of DNA methylation 1-like [Gossypium australe]
MDFSSGEESDLSESEINEYKEKPYEEIRSGKYKGKALSGNLKMPLLCWEEETRLQVQGPASTCVWKQYILPWMGIIMNIVAESKNIDELRDKGYWLNRFVKYKPSDVQCFWNEEDSTGQAVLTFTSKWVGFLNATEFEKAFESEHHAKKHWNGRQAQLGSNIYGWYARADDYHSDGPVRKVGKLQTISGIVQETDQDRSYVLAKLAAEIDLTNENLNELRYKYNTTTTSLSRTLEKRDRLHLDFIEDLRGKLQVMEHLKHGGAAVKEKMEELKNELKEKEDDLEDREATNKALINNEYRSNVELQEARKLLIQRSWVLEVIMGELDPMAFHDTSMPQQELLVHNHAAEALLHASMTELHGELTWFDDV